MIFSKCSFASAPAGIYALILFVLVAFRVLFYCRVVSPSETGAYVTNPIRAKHETGFVRRGGTNEKTTALGGLFIWCSCGNSNPGHLD